MTLANHKMAQESAEQEQMIQLLQTQRDIYSRSVHEYSTKALQTDKLTDENEKLKDQVNVMR